MRSAIIVAAAALLPLTGCSDQGPSLDQQQQSWEQNVRDQACAGITNLSPGSLELGWLYRDGASNMTGEQLGQVAAKRPYNCHDDRFERYYQERLWDDFPNSPKGQAGETTAPQPR